MKFAKIAVIGQLAIAAVLVGVFALKSSAKGEHDKAAKDTVAAVAEAGHGAAKAPAAEGDHGDDKAEGEAKEHGEDQGDGHGAGDKHAAKGTKLAQAGHGKDAKDPKATKDGKGKDGKGAKDDDHGGGHGGASALAGDSKTIAKALLAGNERFVTGRSSHPDLERQREDSAKGQHPGVMVLGCADSRVSPELVFDRGIGELFVVRSAGNIAEPVAVGSLEYAVEHLHAKVLVVMGHENCGAVKAALSEEKMPTPNLEALVGHIAPGVKGLKAWAEGDDLVHMAVEANVRRQADELLKRSPVLRQAVAKGEIVILKAVYDLESGRVRPI
jgi:carbonic anhydrase